MSANSEEIVQQMRHEFEALITKVIGAPSGRCLTADAMERGLWQALLQLGHGLMTAFLVHRAQEVTPAHVCLGHDPVLAPHQESTRSYDCVFGQIAFARRYYYRPGHGAFPVDADLNLPLEGTSDLLREWQERLGTSLPYTEANSILEEFLGRPFSNRILQQAVKEDGDLVLDFYEQADPHLPDPEATILVVQADGKGVPLVKDSPAPAVVRPGKGARPGKKEAVVTSVYTLKPAPRTPQSVVTSLFHPETDSEPQERSGPHDKWLMATLDGKSAASPVRRANRSAA